MSDKNRDALYLPKIIEHCDAIGKELNEISLDDFLREETRQKAVLFDLIQIGELANHLSDVFVLNHPELPLGAIIGLRNLIVHGYGTIKLPLIWRYATTDVPKLRERLCQVLR